MSSTSSHDRNGNGNANHHPYQAGTGTAEYCNTSIAGSFFDEVTNNTTISTASPRDLLPYYDSENNSFRNDDGIGNNGHDGGSKDSIEDENNNNNNNNNNQEDNHGNDEYFYNIGDIDNVDVPDEEYSQEYTNDLPTLVILTDNDNPNHISNPPQCVGVRDAGVPHINGVYLLARNSQTVGSEHQQQQQQPPLYFKDGPPILLEDGRYYDMCILRINCPDSPNHVIWFMSRVDIDPTCLDVKFSDCYYYCRLLASDDGNGDNDANNRDSCPPEVGWNIPRIPPGVSLPIAPSESLSLDSPTENGHEQQHGHYDTHGKRQHDNVLGIKPMAGLGSPGVTKFFPGIGSQLSKYSV